MSYFNDCPCSVNNINHQETKNLFEPMKRKNYGKNGKSRNYTDDHKINRPKQIKDANFKMTCYEPWARPKKRQAIKHKRIFTEYVRGRRRRLLKNSIAYLI